MKRVQNRVHGNDGTKAVVSQSRNRIVRAAAPSGDPCGARLVITDKHGKPWADVALGAALYERLQRACQENGQSIAQFVETACRNKFMREIGDAPGAFSLVGQRELCDKLSKLAADLDCAVNQSNGLAEMLLNVLENPPDVEWNGDVIHGFALLKIHATKALQEAARALRAYADQQAAALFA